MSVQDYWMLENDRRYVSSKMHDDIWYRDCNRKRKDLGKWLCKEAEDTEHDNRWWSPMRYVSEQEINEYVEYIDNIHCTNPTVYIQHGSGMHGSWELYEPGYYRIEHRKEPKDWWWSMSSRTGFPENRRNHICKCFNRVYREKIDKFLDHYVAIEKEEEKKRHDKWIKDLEIKQGIYEQKRDRNTRKIRTRGVTPDVETIAFFQALATGGCVNERLR